jgi:hypothetical protein
MTPLWPQIGTVWLLLNGLGGLLCAPMYRLERKER